MCGFFAPMVCCCAPMRVYMKANCWYKHQHVNCTLPLVWKNVSLGGLLYSFSCSFLSTATDYQWANQWHLVWSVLLGQSFWQYGMLSRWSILKIQHTFYCSLNWFSFVVLPRKTTASSHLTAMSFKSFASSIRIEAVPAIHWSSLMAFSLLQRPLRTTRMAFSTRKLACTLSLSSTLEQLFSCCAQLAPFQSVPAAVCRTPWPPVDLMCGCPTSETALDILRTSTSILNAILSTGTSTWTRTLLTLNR